MSVMSIFNVWVQFYYACSFCTSCNAQLITSTDFLDCQVTFPNFFFYIIILPNFIV